MGTWGENLFSDDTAADVRDAFKEELRRSGSPEVAARAVLEQFASELADPDDAPVVWLALAVTQHKLGYATEPALTEARRVLDDGLGLARWEEQGPAAKHARLKEYARLRATLDSPRPDPRPIKIKKVRFDDSGLKAGDVFRIPIGSEDQRRTHFAYFWVLRIDRERDAMIPVVVLLDYQPPNPDPPADPSAYPMLGIREFGSPYNANARSKAFRPHRWFGRGSPRKLVEVVGRAAPPDLDIVIYRDCTCPEWSMVVKYAVHSLDRSEWLTARILEERCKAEPPEALLADADEIIRRLDQPNLGVVQLRWAASQLLEQRKYAHCLVMLDIAARIDQETRTGLTNRGGALLGLGRTDEAEVQWARALELAAAESPDAVARTQFTVDQLRKRILRKR